MVIFVFGHIWLYSLTCKNGKKKRNRKSEDKAKYDFSIVNPWP